MVCPGTVYHRRNRPRLHQFRYPVSYLWLDPDRPDDVCGAHWAWSSTSPLAPVRFHPEDYGLNPDRGATAPGLMDLVGLPLGHQAKAILARSAGVVLDGPVRMITQPRRFGWLFNPITVYLVWDEPDADPAGVVLEVTNTPWKERHHYAVALHGGPACTARFDKVLHVSPFLDEDYHYDMRLSADNWTDTPSQSGRATLELALDVVDGTGEAVVETLLKVNPVPATSRTLRHALLRHGLPTHRTSFGIHYQAVKLAAKRVPFIAHPRSRN